MYVKRNIQERSRKYGRPLHVSMLNTRYCQIQINLESSPRIFEKPSNIKLHQTRQVGAELFNAHRRTKRQT